VKSLLASMVFVSLIVGAACLTGRLTLAVYSLSFWHYYLYWLAYSQGAVSLGVFKRDAIVMKTVSLLALALVYLAEPLDLVSLGVVASGFALNVVAAGALGADRTYYGHEVAALPRQRITAFPYSCISHPMLVGNMAAFGGTMINSAFRQQWGRLACAHLAMNVGLVVMELAVTPRRGGALRAPIGGASSRARRCAVRTGCGIVAAGAVLGGAAGHWGTWRAGTLLGAGMGAGMFAYAYVLYCCYSRPTLLAGQGRGVQAEGSS
jgi:protein-S-isoprenylcysteine O-methyltransferase Ste14